MLLFHDVYDRGHDNSKLQLHTGDPSKNWNLTEYFHIRSRTEATPLNAIIYSLNFPQNPGSPSPKTNDESVSYTIEKTSADVCWLRLGPGFFSGSYVDCSYKDSAICET